MRAISFKTHSWFMLLVLSIADFNASGQDVIGIRDSAWRYYQQGDEPRNVSQPGVSWRMPNFDDSAGNWASGTGVHGVEGAAIAHPIQTGLSLIKPGDTNQVLAYYFRTHFNYAGPTNVFLNFTNQIDDGVVVYLNGNELYRIRMPAGTPTSNTQATAPAVGDAALEFREFFSSPHLRQGDNVLAVEVHQQGLTSSDIVMGIGLRIRVVEPIVITRHPESEVNAQVGDSVELSVEATGDDPRYWWFRNNTFLTNQTNALLRMNNIQLTNAGTYHVVVSNVISGARSSNSIVNVFTDTIPPYLINAVVRFDANEPSNRVYAIFSEDVLRVAAIRENCPGPSCTTNYSRSATNAANYSLREVAPPGNEIDILSALPGVGSASVRLTLATNIDCNKEYVLTVRDLTDNKTNVMSPNPGYAIVGCVLRSNLIASTAFWRHTETFEGFGMAANWYSTNYTEDSNWPSSPAPFAFSAECENNCFGLIGSASGCQGSATPLSVGWPTYLFRHTFVMSNPPAVGLLRLRYVTDDGAVFYLNDKELFRTNIADGPLDFNTVALNCIEGTCQTNTYTVDNLQRGTNVFALRLHDCNDAVDVMFALELDLVFTNYPTRIPEIQVSRTTTPRRIILKWDPNGWRLQTSTTVTGGWANVVGVSTNATGYTNSLPFIGNRFYRLCRP